MYLNWYQLVNVYQESTAKTTHNTIELRKISKFTWVIGFIRPGGSNYLRGFAILPTAMFTSWGSIELTFLQGATPYYADITYIDDTTVQIAKNTPAGLDIYLYGISIGPVDLSS